MGKLGPSPFFEPRNGQLITIYFLRQSLDQVEDVYVDHMCITEDDSSVVVLLTDRFVTCRLFLAINIPRTQDTQQ